MAIINIVMVEPEIPQNTGNVARTCAATGARLHLVGPMGFKIDDKKLKRAGLDYWNLLDITYYDSIEEFFAKNQGEFYFFTTKGRSVYSDVSYPDNCYLFFGKETKMGEARSLNLSNTVAIATYEVLRQWNFPELQNFGQLHNYRWEDV